MEQPASLCRSLYFFSRSGGDSLWMKNLLVHRHIHTSNSDPSQVIRVANLLSITDLLVEVRSAVRIELSSIFGRHHGGKANYVNKAVLALALVAFPVRWETGLNVIAARHIHQISSQICQTALSTP